MSFSRRVKYFLVHSLFLSNKVAQELIDNGQVEIDGQAIFENESLQDHSEIKVKGNIVRQRISFVYLKFYKPAGFESTMNITLEHNLSSFFPGFTNLAIAGRLDKQSEGLLLLSNDGKWVESLCNPKFEKEKEYLVTLNKDPGEDFTKSFSSGVRIGTYLTKKCFCRRIDVYLVNIILTEGKNRQIRRMCKALGYRVQKLQRIRIDGIKLDNLKEGEFDVIKI